MWKGLSRSDAIVVASCVASNVEAAIQPAGRGLTGPHYPGARSAVPHHNLNSSTELILAQCCARFLARGGHIHGRHGPQTLIWGGFASPPPFNSDVDSVQSRLKTDP